MIIHQKKIPEEETIPADPIIEEAGSPDPSDTEELIRRAKAGDDEAFGEIVSLYERFVYNTVCRVLTSQGGSVSDAEDAAQTAFIKAWRNLSSFRGECTFTTWIFRIAVNTAKDSLRSASRHKTVSLSRTDDDGEETEWDLPETTAEVLPEENLEKQETIRGVRRAIEELPEEQRQVLILRDLHELPYSQIAEMLSLELGTVKSRLNRARLNLKNLLKNGNFL